MSLKLFYKVGCSPEFFNLPQDLGPLIIVAELMVPVKTFKIQNLQKSESGKLPRIYEKLPRSYGKLRWSDVFFGQLSAKH